MEGGQIKKKGGKIQTCFDFQTRKRPPAHGTGPMPRLEPLRAQPLPGTELRQPERGGGG